MMYFQLDCGIIYCAVPNWPPYCFALLADPNTLFRSNSLASKAMEQFMKVRQRVQCFYCLLYEQQLTVHCLCCGPFCQAVGMLYLHEVLKPIINRIFEEKKYIELDPCKIDLNRTR